MINPVTVKTVKTVKTYSDSDSVSLSQPYKGVAVTVTLSASCRYCQNWAGAPDSLTAYCTLPRAGIIFTATGRDTVCAAYTPTDKGDVSAQGHAADEGTTGAPEHIAIEPANAVARVETWERVDILAIDDRAHGVSGENTPKGVSSGNPGRRRAMTKAKSMDEMTARQDFYWQIRKEFSAKHGRQPTISELEREAKEIEDRQAAAKAKASPPAIVKTCTKGKWNTRLEWAKMKKDDAFTAVASATPETFPAAVKELRRMNKLVEELS